MGVHGRRITAGAAAVATFLAACGTAFVEPTPPALSVVTKRFESGSRDEPVVTAVILDLHVAGDQACTAARDRVLATVRAAAAATGAATRELPVQDLAPGCVQRAARHVDLDAFEAAVAAAEAALPDAWLRPVVLYANNVDLTLPLELQQDFEELRRRAEARGALTPEIWALSLARLDDTVYFEERIAWTHSGDEAMWTGLADAFAESLPFVTRTGTELVGAPLLDPPLDGEVDALRICGAPADAAVRGCRTGGALCFPRPGMPVADVRFPALAAVRKADLPTLTAEFRLEVCTARCDRYLDRAGTPTRWDSLDGCLLAGGAP